MATCCSLDAELASKHDSIQEQTDKVLKKARCRSQLNHYLDELDRKFSVNLRDQEVINIRKDMEYIASQFAKKVACHDARFKGEILNSGSHYEGLQVSAPDEFDYMIEIEELSKQSMVDFRPTTDSGFFYGYSKASNRWKDCISLFCTDHNQPLRLQSICPLCSNNSKLYQRILDPEKVQDVFRKIADEVMEELLLPKYWEHGGFNRPRFSGHRKHGPATMFQLIYRTEKEIKINIDITLAIKVPKPTPSVVLQSLKIMRQEPCSSRMDVRILLGTDPGVHMIPLYSKMMLQKRKYAKKHAWRLSTSLVEGRIFQELGYDALPSRAIRVMKILRKEYLTYFSRKTVRQRRPRKTAAKKNKASQKEQVRNQIEDDTTDLTDNDEDESSKTKNYFIKGAITELQKLFEDLDVTFDPVVMKREQYQLQDVGLMSDLPKPGSGEYYGAKQYVASIEIKMAILELVLKDSELGLSTIDLAGTVLHLCQVFKSNMAQGRVGENVFSGGEVCTLPSSEKTNRAKLALNKLLSHLVEVASKKT